MKSEYYSLRPYRLTIAARRRESPPLASNACPAMLGSRRSAVAAVVSRARASVDARRNVRLEIQVSRGTID
jgi:hypothetical protein